MNLIRNWTAATIRGELNRKRERLRDQAFDLDQEEAWILKEKAKAAKRRPYTHKNNGKGRPRKKIKEFSLEKAERRQLLTKNIALLDQLCLFAEDLKDVGVFQAQLVGLLAEERSRPGFDQMRLKMLQGLCRQFCGDALLKFPLPWENCNVRAFLELVSSKATRIASLSNPKGGGLLSLDWAPARAEADIIERLFRLGDLQSDITFVTALNTYRDAPPQQQILPAQEWKQIWQQTCERLRERTAKVFVIRPVGELKPAGRGRRSSAKSADLPFENSKPDVIPLDPDTSQDEPWSKQYQVTDHTAEVEELKQLDAIRERFSRTMWSAREEALNPLKAEGHITSAINFAQTLVAAVRSVLECRTEILAATPKSKRSLLRKAFARSNSALLFWLRANLEDMTILARELAEHGGADWDEEAKKSATRHQESRSSWPALHMQLSAIVSKAHLDLKTAARMLKP